MKNNFIVDNIQEKKILEMCDDLFFEFSINKEIINENLFFIFEKNNSKTFIHWFELCITHLPQKIANNFNTVYPKEKHAFIIDLMMKKMLNFSNLEKVHPIDFLFEMYKKTNDNLKNI